MKTTRNISRFLQTAAFAAASFMLAACSDPATKSSKNAPPPPAVEVEQIQPAPFARTLQLTGSVEPTRVATLSSPAEGPVQDCAVREGDRVRQGEILLSIGRQTSAAANLQSALEETKRQQREFERISSLVAEKALPADQLDAARAALEKARAAYALAEQVSADYQVPAPWDGIVSRVHVADGKYLSPRASLVDLFDPASLALRFRVPEQHALALQEGDQLAARFDAFPEKTFELTIVRAYPELDRHLRQRTFEATLPLDQAAFQPGLFARLRIPLEQINQALTVPVEAIIENADGTASVFQIQNGKAISTSVTLGFEQDGRRWVKTGLVPGATVAVRGLEQLRDGLPVRLAHEI
ncbi:auxiliary transport protein, MFP family, putative [Verrucomicrobiia bacterium DG1235]|nr:auxiliary transport protein, MFP family, putative [Verrucomicrobiae bacterium DG1235]